MAGTGSARPTPLMLVLLAPVALLITVVLAWTDVGRLMLARAMTPGKVLSYGYGSPMDWLFQYAPFHLQDELLFRDPRAVHTTVAWGPFVVDLALAYILLLGVLWAARWVLRLVSSSHGSDG